MVAGTKGTPTTAYEGISAFDDASFFCLEDGKLLTSGRALTAVNMTRASTSLIRFLVDAEAHSNDTNHCTLIETTATSETGSHECLLLVYEVRYQIPRRA